MGHNVSSMTFVHFFKFYILVLELAYILKVDLVNWQNMPFKDNFNVSR